MKLPQGLDPDTIVEAAESDDGRGFCLACGEEHYDIEPDAREYLCESCGADEVYGAEELLLMGAAS